MKKNILIIIFLAMFFGGYSQNPQPPSGKPGKPQLPVPKIRPLAPADLTATGITFVSIVLNNDTKIYVVKVIVTTRNNGEMRSAKTQLRAYSKTPSGAGSWTVIGDPGNVDAIDPGRSYSSVYSFKGSALVIGGVPFDFRVKTDSGNLVTESDETNNFSATIVINPRAH